MRAEPRHSSTNESGPDCLAVGQSFVAAAHPGPVVPVLPVLQEPQRLLEPRPLGVVDPVVDVLPPLKYKSLIERSPRPLL